MADFYPFQRQLLNDIGTGKIKPGEMIIAMSGRNSGKSMATAATIERLMKDLMNRPVESLICSESRVCGARYYCVEPVGGNWVEMEKWCVETFGDPSDFWDLKNDSFMWPVNGRWYKNNRKFWFRNAKDRDWFIVRWNS